MKKNNKAGFMFLELLIVLVIIVSIFYMIFNFYFKKMPIERNNAGFLKEQQFISESNIDIRSPKSIVDSTRSRLEDAQRKHQEELDKIINHLN